MRNININDAASNLLDKRILWELPREPRRSATKIASTVCVGEWEGVACSVGGACSVVREPFIQNY